MNVGFTFIVSVHIVGHSVDDGKKNYSIVIYSIDNKFRNENSKYIVTPRIGLYVLYATPTLQILYSILGFNC
jgi:hypothetical protein